MLFNKSTSLMELQEDQEENDDIESTSDIIADNVSPIKKFTEKHYTRSKLHTRHLPVDSPRCNIECIKLSLQTNKRKIHKPFLLCEAPMNRCETDPTLQLTRSKQQYQMLVDKLRTVYKRSQKRLDMEKQFQCYKNMQRLVDKDPDKYFCSNYNWYYTGGILDIKNFSDSLYIFHATNGTQLSLSKAKREDCSWYLQKSEILNSDCPDIFQVESLYSGSGILVSARHKYEVSLHSVQQEKEHDTFTCRMTKVLVSDVPYVGLCVNKFRSERFSTVDALQTIKIWDGTAAKEVSKITVSNDYQEDDCFAQIMQHDKDTLAYINRKCLQIFDTRLKSSTLNLSGHDLLSSKDDSFTNVCFNKVDYSYCYISSFTDLMQVDLRSMAVVNKWSHSFSAAPFQSDSICHNAQNIVCISSYNPDEKILVEHNEHSGSIPRYLPTLIQSFDYSALMKPNLSKSRYIKNRLNMSTAGLCISNVDSDIFTVFSVNVMGDIFGFDVAFGDSEDSEKKYRRFQEWDSKIVPWDSAQDKLHFVDKVTLTNLKLDNRKDPEVENEDEALKKCVENLKATQEYIHKFSDVWHDDGDRMQIENIEELPVESNIANWLSNVSEVPPDD